MFSDSTRTWVILVLVIFVPAAAGRMVALCLIRQHATRVTDALTRRKDAAKMAKFKELEALERSLEWNRKQLDMVRFSGNTKTAESQFVSSIVEIERRMNRLSAEL